MWRMVLVTFVFLGYAFYEISGGSDFEPRLLEVERTSAAQPALDAGEGALAVPSTERAPAAVQLPKLAPSEGARTIRVPSSGGAVAAPTSATVDPAKTDLSSLAKALQSGLSIDQPGRRTSLLTPEESKVDLREITGLRVNMRDGPGTDFPVLRRLSLGQQVEVLDTSGSGWVRLRMVTGGQVGWVSGSLVSDAVN